MDSTLLVAGAGPVGLTMAMALKRQGIPVRIIDQNTSRTDKSKALVLWPRTLELLDIQGCTQPFIDAGVKARGARIFADGHQLAHVELDIARSVYRYVLMIPQSETERLLEVQLDALGVKVERTLALESFADTGSEVVATLRHADGQSEVMHTPYLLGCDGAHSVTRNGLGMAFEGSTMASDWMLGDLHIDGPLAQDELTMCWTKEGVLAVFPMGGNRFRIIADVGLATGDLKPPPTLDQIQAVLDARGPSGLRSHDPFWLSHFRINERKVSDYRRGRVFLSGDAAHIHSPAGGQGMNTGMQDAFNLGWKIALVCKGIANDSLLDSYSVERSAIGDQVLRNAGRMTEVAMLRNPLLQELRNIVASTLMGHVSAVRQRMVDALTEVDLHYPDSPLTRAPYGASSHPRGGDRATDVALVASDAATTHLHALLASGKFVVLSVGVPRVVLPDAVISLATSARIDADAGYASGHAYLIRPDAYVSLSTDGTNNAEMIAMLEGISASR